MEKHIKRIVNLTVLVDVLMIMLFCYIMQSSSRAELQEQKAQKQMEQVKLKYEEKISGLEDRVSELEKVVGAECSVVTLELQGGLQEDRNLKLTEGEEENDYTFSFETQSEMKDELYQILLQKAQSKENLYVIFIYDGSQSYASDVRMIDTILSTIYEQTYITRMVVNTSKH